MAQGRGKGKGKLISQAYVVQVDYYDITTSTAINSMVLFLSSWAHTLFDTSASSSFILVLFVSILGFEYKPLDSTLSVGVPLGQDCELLYHCSLVRI